MYYDAGTQSNIVVGLAFSADGTKMFVLCSSTDYVYQYTLSTAWDVSTASYASISFSTVSQDTYPESLRFSVDGTKMYVLGGGNDYVYQYTLSTAWDLSTASYANKSFSVVGQNAYTEGLEFSVDGTKMFVVSRNFSYLYQYTLSTAWDVSTASYASINLDLAPTADAPSDLVIGNGGKNLYVLDQTNDAIYQYSIDGSVYATVTYPAAFNFPVGLAPDVPKDDVVNVLDFVTTDGGTTWYGTQIGEDYK